MAAAGAPSRRAGALLIASTFWQRARGLLGTHERDVEGRLLLITPCSAIHTLFMRYSIDVAFLNREGVILKAVRDVSPGRWRLACHGAVGVIERHAGRTGETWLMPGDRVCLAMMDDQPEHAADE